MAWNLLNLIDEDRLPQYRLPDGAAPGQPPSRAVYAFENLPMINEVVVSNAAVTAEGSPSYAVSVELWYPFEPDSSPENLVLAVGIYTNRADLPDLATDPGPGPGEDLGPFGFTNVVPLLYGPGRQFHVASSHELVRFTEGPVENPAAYELGPARPLYIWPRLYLLCTNTASYVCVDEALLETQGDIDHVDIIDTVDRIREWRATGSWQAGDPFFNLPPREGEFGQPPTLWARNANLAPGFEYPRFHLNRPLESAGELGYLSLAQTGVGTAAFTNTAGAALLDRFTAFPTNRPERAAADRIQPNSPSPEVIARLFDEPLLSRPVADDDLPDIETLTNAWFTARKEWIAQSKGDSWNTFSNLLPAVAARLAETWTGLDPDDASVQSDERKLPQPLVIEDLLRGLADRVTFRQNLYVVIIAAQRLSPLGRVIADQRVAVTVVRDAYTGRWAVHDWRPLTE